MKVTWTAQAEIRLAEIENFIGRDSPERAAAFIEKLIRRGEKLNHFPGSGRRVSELNIENLREVIESFYRIVYRILPNEIQILTVFEGHRLLRLEEVL